MVQLVELECPNCGASLQKTGEKTAKCPHCSATFLIDEGQPENVTNIYQAPQSKRSPLATFVIIFLSVIVFIAMVAIRTSEKSQTTTTAVAENTAEKEGITSEFFQELVERIYDVPYDKVKKSELEKLTYLYIYWKNDCNVVEYAMEDGEVKQIELSGSLRADYEDIKNFTGLKTLKVPNVGFAEGYLDDMKELTEIWSCNSPEYLAVIVPKPENIKILGCYSADSLIGLDAFKNVEQFLVKDSDLTDITALSALTNLKSLEIYSGDAITDFGVLHSLTGLEKLYLDSEGLKDVSFLQNMQSLQELSLKDTIVLDISALQGKTALKSLHLTGNDEVLDFSALSSLSGLETLELDLSSSQQMPAADGWQNLTSLSISGVDEIGFLSALPNLKSLYISGCNCDAFGVLTSLPNLEELELGSIYGEMSSFDTLAGLTTLKSLDISGITVYGNANAIFAIPGLEELNINDCSFGLDFAAVSENTSLKKLSMSRLAIWENISVAYDGMVTYLDYDEVSLDENMTFLSRFPNLEELYLQSNKVTNVDFTESLMHLKKLDITGNYVTDLRPLGKLEQLEIVWCGENSISQGSDLGEEVTVILDSEADEGVWWK